ncbi:MAG: PEP-CTERM sorting domain-containing protein, partial [Planctomycetota bacterium]
VSLVASTTYGSTLFPKTIDFATDSTGTPLANGQAVTDTGGVPTLAVSDLFVLSAPQSAGVNTDNLGLAIFDSDPVGPNIDPPGQDGDLLVDQGNVLILQNDAFPTQTTPGIFDTPNDEASNGNNGYLLFEFVDPVELVAIDVVDIDDNESLTITLTDTGGLTRTFSVPEHFTNDIADEGPAGFETILLLVLSDQEGEGTGGPTTAVEDLGFDEVRVVKLEIALGGSTSAAFNNLVIGGVTTMEIPEPTAMALLLVAASSGLYARRR